MNDKKTPGSLPGQPRGTALSCEESSAEPLPSQDHVVRLYPGRGAVFYAPCVGTPGAPGIRKGIAKWSAASRRRMRLALATSAAPATWAAAGVTLTVPGPVMALTEYRQLWESFLKRLSLWKISMLWRVEMQKRGALHYHGIVWSEPRRINRIDTRGAAEHPQVVIQETWFKCIRDLGEITFSPPYFGPENNWKKGITWAQSRMGLPGAVEHAFSWTSEHGARGAWLRYLQDHTTKAKQEQVPENIGRHWGIIGRKFLTLQEPEQTERLTPAEYARFLRAFQRMCTPSFKNPRSVFGRSLGFRIRRGSRGTSVWFSECASVRRLLDWAKGETECRTVIPSESP